MKYPFKAQVMKSYNRVSRGFFTSVLNTVDPFMKKSMIMNPKNRKHQGIQLICLSFHQSTLSEPLNGTKFNVLI